MLQLIHCWLPVLLGWSLARVIQHAEGGVLSPVGLALLLAGIGAAYSFDRIVDTPEGEEMTSWLRGMLSGGVVVCGGMILLLVTASKIETRVLGVVAFLAVASLAYSRLKRFPLLKTVVVTLAWTWACSALPVNGTCCHRLFPDVTLPLMLLIAAGCILCDLKDIEEDRARHIPSLPALFGLHSACLIATGLAFLSAILAILYHRFGITAGAALLVMAAQFPSILAMKSIGPIVVDSILILPGVLISTGVV